MRYLQLLVATGGSIADNPVNLWLIGEYVGSRDEKRTVMTANSKYCLVLRNKYFKFFIKVKKIQENVTEIRNISPTGVGEMDFIPRFIYLDFTVFGFRRHYDEIKMIFFPKFFLVSQKNCSVIEKNQFFQCFYLIEN